MYTRYADRNEGLLRGARERGASGPPTTSFLDLGFYRDSFSGSDSPLELFRMKDIRIRRASWTEPRCLVMASIMWRFPFEDAMPDSISCDAEPEVAFDANPVVCEATRELCLVGRHAVNR